MTTQILMPTLSPTMETGTLVKWHVKEGDAVRSGDVIAEIETDKATMEVEAVDEGIVGKLLVPEGTEQVPVNQPIALLLGEGEDLSAVIGSSPQRGEVASRGDRDGKAPEDVNPAPQPSLQRQEEEQASAERVMDEIAAQIRGNGRERVFASPLARRLARERSIDIQTINGSGPYGRIVKADIERAAARTSQAAQPRAAEPHRAHQPELVKREPPAPHGMSDGQVLALYAPDSYELVPLDTMRRFIADRLTLSKQTIPHFYLNIDCELDAVLAARARLNGMAPQDGPRAFKLSVNDFIIKAFAMALQAVTGANATWTESGLLRHRASDIAVAVALEGGGLHTPVIRNAEVKSLSEISNEMRDLAARARSKRLAPHEYQGGSTTISNLGMYGIDRFDAVINPPQASILAVGRGEKRAIVKDDALTIATMMSVTLSVDHRVIDGALGAELLAAFKAYIEDPVTMLV
jgi:pyruvate dehydrogenase E2 component (dihydrolipoyllysine-residue acetyltransferase)